MNRKTKLTTAIAALGMLVLILDSKTALVGAQNGVRLCIYSLVPSLFPFLFLSILLTSGAKNTSIRHPFTKWLRIPPGGEYLLLIGILSGYPTGAQCISQAYESGSISKHDADRMLAFCNNCGPAFLFGIVAPMFPYAWMPWALWGIHVLSALLVAAVIPGKYDRLSPTHTKPLSISGVLKRSITVIAQVCGWAVLFRVLIQFLSHWFGFLLDPVALVGLSGLLELANGCLSLDAVTDLGQRFVLCSAMLSLGGLCVTMQTMGVISEKLDIGLYFPGKVLQCMFSILFSSVICAFQFSGSSHIIVAFSTVILAVICVIFLRKSINCSSNLQSAGV